MPYYGNRISEHIAIRQPEGYLICQAVPVARTGMQEYAPQELGRQGDQMIPVYRAEEDVFSPATVASFEGMPVTNDHPNEDVDTNNIRVYQRGHAQNIRRGEGEQSDLLLADLVITHPDLIDAIQNGKREVSCGYQCEYQETDGKIFQRAIRGNHVAVVEQGRAGPRVAIKDQSPAQGKERSSSMSKPNGIIGKIFKPFARDAEPEDIEEAGKLLFGAKDACAEPVMKKDADPVAPNPVAPSTQPPAGQQVQPPPKDEDPMAVIAKALADLTAQVAALKNQLAPTPDADPLAQLEKEVGAPPASASAEGNLIDPEKMADEDPEPAEEERPDEEKKATQDLAFSIKMASDIIRPIIAELPKDKQQAARDTAAKQIRAACGLSAAPASGAKDNPYLAVKQAAAKPKDAKPTESNERDLGQRIMASRNANLRAPAQPGK